MESLEEETIESILKTRNEHINLEDIPHTELTEKYPGYYEWYALENEDNIRIFKHEIGLHSEVRENKGMTNLNYYHYGYEYVIKKHIQLVNRQDCYRLVEKYYGSEYRDRRALPYALAIPKEEVSYRLDTFYRNISNWGKLKWDGFVED
jgi:hypothetical protein